MRQLLCLLKAQASPCFGLAVTMRHIIGTQLIHACSVILCLCAMPGTKPPRKCSGTFAGHKVCTTSEISSSTDSKSRSLCKHLQRTANEVYRSIYTSETLAGQANATCTALAEGSRQSLFQLGTNGSG